MLDRPLMNFANGEILRKPCGRSPPGSFFWPADRGQFDPRHREHRGTQSSPRKAIPSEGTKATAENSRARVAQEIAERAEKHVCMGTVRSCPLRHLL